MVILRTNCVPTKWYRLSTETVVLRTGYKMIWSFSLSSHFDTNTHWYSANQQFFFIIWIVNWKGIWLETHKLLRSHTAFFSFCLIEDILVKLVEIWWNRVFRIYILKKSEVQVQIRTHDPQQINYLFFLDVATREYWVSYGNVVWKEESIRTIAARSIKLKEVFIKKNIYTYNLNHKIPTLRRWSEKIESYAPIIKVSPLVLLLQIEQTNRH